MSWIPKDGSTIRFWTDAWAVQGRLCDIFSDLYNSIRHKNCSLYNYVIKHNHIDRASPYQSDFDEINRIINDSHWSPTHSFDTPVWNASQSKAYSVHSFYMEHDWQNPTDYRHHASLVLPIPPVVFTFAWSLIWDGLPTMDKIQSRFLNWNLSPQLHEM